MEKVCCQSYEIDYKKVVDEMSNYLLEKADDLTKGYKKELNPLKYIELTAQAMAVNQCYNALLELKQYCKKPIQVSIDNKVVE